jgi:hypothetical protein
MKNSNYKPKLIKINIAIHSEPSSTSGNIVGIYTLEGTNNFEKQFSNVLNRFKIQCGVSFGLML